jgi:hypothetical protein
MALEKDFMSRISIDVTEDKHKKLKAMAALRGQSITTTYSSER